jgi:hypothetical protein
MKKIIIAGIGFAVLGISSFVLAGDVTLAWDASAGTIVPTGYKIHYGIESGSYTDSVDVGNTTQGTVTGITNGVLYYYAATAYTAEKESVFSEEISYVLPLVSTSMGNVQKMRKKVP